MSLSPFKTYLNPIHHNFLQKHYTCEHKTLKTALTLTKKLQNWFFLFFFFRSESNDQNSKADWDSLLPTVREKRL